MSYVESSSVSRRTFLKACGTLPLAGNALASLATAAPKEAIEIDRIEIVPVRYPMAGYFKFFTGPHGSAGRAA